MKNISKRAFTSHRLLLGGLIALSGALVFAPAAQAQNRVTAESSGRLAVVELKDVSLGDALRLVFSAAGVGNYNIDPQADTTYINDINRTNIGWNDLVQQLVRENDFQFKKDPATGLYLIDPRNPQGTMGAGGFGGPGSFPGAGGRPSSTPPSPFGNGRSPRSNTNNQLNFQVRPPSTGSTKSTAADDENKRKFTPILIQHVYVGGIAGLFDKSTVIRSEDFVSPEYSGGNGGSGGGGGGFGNNNSGGGFGNSSGGSSFGGFGSSSGGSSGGFGGSSGGSSGFGGGFGF